MTTTPTQLASVDTLASLSPMAADLLAVALVAIAVMVVLQTTRRWSRASTASAA